MSASDVQGRKRNVTIAGMDSSPGSIDDMDENDSRDDKRRQPVKRACNECRQQKLRCDVVQDPWSDCSRCRRLKLDCKIESNFKRVGKRSRNAEMEREIIELRKQIASGGSVPTVHQQQQHGSPGQLTPKQESSQVSPAGVYQTQTPSALSTDQYMGSQEAVASLLDLRSGYDSSNYLRNGGTQIKRIEDVMVVPEKATELFNLFFTYYHPFLPFLDRQQSADDYFNTSPLLFWTIISVGARRYQSDTGLLTSLAGPVTRLVWSTLADIPQSYHVVKALCLLCSWPFPTSSTSTDPTFMLCGMMVQVAMQLGLHRPSHSQDFSKFRVELIEEELRDKVRTWAICNIVAQRVSTGYGQPPSSLYDWTLSGESSDVNFKLPGDIKPRLEIEKFCDKITRSLYSNRRDPVGLSSDQERLTMISFLSRDFDELEEHFKSQNDCITDLYLRAANLHLHLSAFFDDPSAKDYRGRLLSLYVATTSFLEAAMNLETEVGPVLSYTPYYVYQMMVAAGCTLLKLSKSFFSNHIDMDYTKTLFNRTIWAIRGVSVSNNDLPERLAEVLAQMWRLGVTSKQSATSNADVDDSLRLKVRCRMSMSLLFDSVWRWREDARTKGRNIEAYLKNPTNPDSTADSSVGSSVGPPRTSSSTPGIAGGDPSLAPAPILPNLGVGAAPSNGAGGLPSGFIEPNYEVFDPLNWLLDGLVDLPYSYSTMSGMETQIA
ncbi:C6 transcription factor (Leu3) [Penicillium sp. IBT 18751x]|nr:C6 transcription factor (Leu3) [Penicillium sp. IBT 18751x]